LRIQNNAKFIAVRTSTYILHLSGKNDEYLEYVSSLVVLDSPAEAPEYGRHLVRVEEREETVQQHLQLHRNCVETLPQKAGVRVQKESKMQRRKF
jgi:hypothetical protein